MSSLHDRRSMARPVRRVPAIEPLGLWVAQPSESPNHLWVNQASERRGSQPSELSVCLGSAPVGPPWLVESSTRLARHLEPHRLLRCGAARTPRALAQTGGHSALDRKRGCRPVLRWPCRGATDSVSPMGCAKLACGKMEHVQYVVHMEL